MKERTIRLERRDWDNANVQRHACISLLCVSLRDTHISLDHGFVDQVVGAVAVKVMERLAYEKENGLHPDSDLLIGFSLGEDSWKLKMGSVLWTQPRARV